VRITVHEARGYFAHVSQQAKSDISPDDLPEDGVQYWADSGVCVALHQAHWPRVWMAHVAVNPAAWGHTKEPALRILDAFWKAEAPELIVGWTSESNRAALAFARRLGFVEYGRMDLPSGGVICQKWRPLWA
jgi:hypothetical protein